MGIHMKTILEWIGFSWKCYWGGGYYQYLLLAAGFYLLIFHRKKRYVRQTLAFCTCLLFVFLFPLTAKCISFCIGENVYWRVLWLLPTIPVVALAATEFLRSRHSRLVQTILLLCCCGVIALSGKDMLSAGNFTRTNNRMKVPDDIAHIANALQEAAAKDNIPEICVITDDDYPVTYLRVYDPSIKQGYGRRMGGVRNHACYRVYRLLLRPTLNYRKFAKLSKRGGCNFIVIRVPEKKMKKIERFGYVKIGEVGSYTIFELKEP